MSVSAERPWAKPSTIGRVVPTVLVLALLAGVAVASTAKGRSEPTERITGPSLAEVRAYPDISTRPVTYDEALAAGTVDRYDWGSECDVERPYNDTDQTLARIAIPSTYAPPCVPVWDGEKPWVDQGGDTHEDNGGATAPGVTATTIKVVYYLAGELDITKQLESFGVADSQDVQLQGVRDLVEMNNHLYETYGRKVEVVPFRATGDGRSPTAAKADAVKVAEMGAFASIGGPTQTSSYQHELARLGVLCFQCGYASTGDVLATDAPYAWGHQATPDQLLFGALGYGSGLLYDSKAKFAGDAETRAEQRKFGIVHYEQDPPVFGPLKEEATAEFAAKGRSASAIIQYLLDPNSLNAQAQAIVGRLKREGITTVVFLGDPLMPRVLTQQATKQDYHPEWIFTGTVFTDTTVVSRLYDQDQMAHAFGISSNPARLEPELTESWKLYEWWFGEEPEAPRTMLLWGPVIQELYLGIHLAGPDLRAETFAGGMFDYPPTGGTSTKGLTGVELFAGGYLEGDTTPGISFGFHTGDEAADYVGVDDFTTVWWDSKAKGPDENGTEGSGMWLAAGKGLRSSLSDPSQPEGVTQDFLFQRMLSGTGSPLINNARFFGIDDIEIARPILDAVPKLNVLPEYPVRKDAPAADG